MLQVAWSPVVEFFNNYGQAIQTIAVLAGLLFLTVQARQVGKQLQLSNITSSSVHFNDLNDFLLQDKDLLAKFGERPETVFAARVFGTYESRYLLHEARLLDDSLWAGDVVTITKAFGHAVLRDEWANMRDEYHAGFRVFIDTEIIPKADALKVSHE